MSSSQQLYNRVSTKLQALHPSLHLKRLTVWVWVVIGLREGQSVQLSEIAIHIPGGTRIFEDGDQQGLAGRLFVPAGHSMQCYAASRSVAVSISGMLLRFRLE
jgi:hypothetical protein